MGRVLLAAMIAASGDGEARSLYQRFCQELELAGRVHAEGASGDESLRCLLDRAEAARCARAMGLSDAQGDLLASRGGAFEVAGGPEIGFTLRPSRMRLEQLEHSAMGSPFRRLIELRLRLSDLEQDQKIRDTSASAAKAEAEGQPPQGGAAAPPTSDPAEREAVARELADALQKQLGREKPGAIKACIQRQLRELRPSATAVEEKPAKAATHRRTSRKGSSK